MKKSLLLVLIIAPLIAAQGCFYASVTSPLDTDVDRTVLGSKVGRASVKSILYLVAWGDAGVAAAAKNGELHQVNHLDVEYKSILFGLYTQSTTIAYGE